MSARLANPVPDSPSGHLADITLPSMTLWSAIRGEPWPQVLAAVVLMRPELITIAEREFLAGIVGLEPGEATESEAEMVRALFSRTARLCGWCEP